jgi:hypothetical protein
MGIPTKGQQSRDHLIQEICVTHDENQRLISKTLTPNIAINTQIKQWQEQQKEYNEIPRFTESLTARGIWNLSHVRVGALENLPAA